MEVAAAVVAGLPEEKRRRIQPVNLAALDPDTPAGRRDRPPPPRRWPAVPPELLDSPSCWPQLDPPWRELLEVGPRPV